MYININQIHCPPKVWKRPRKVWFWTISHFQAVQILFGEETVSWHHVCHGMASPITWPQPNWATRNWTVMSVRSVQPVWIIFGQSFRRLGVIYQCLNKLTARMPRLCRAVIAANGGYFDESKIKFFLCINCLCNKICFCSLCCPLSVQNYHKLKRIRANIVQNPIF